MPQNSMMNGMMGGPQGMMNGPPGMSMGGGMGGPPGMMPMMGPNGGMPDMNMNGMMGMNGMNGMMGIPPQMSGSMPPIPGGPAMGNMNMGQGFQPDPSMNMNVPTGIVKHESQEMQPGGMMMPMAMNDASEVIPTTDQPTDSTHQVGLLGFSFSLSGRQLTTAD